MCGRFCFIQKAPEVAARFDVETPSLFEPLYNAAPGQNLPVIANNNPRVLSRYRWGLIPSWAHDPAIGSRMINARSETVREKPAFRHLYGKKHCLIPVSGFFEWQKQPSGKQPYLLYLPENTPCALAGLYDAWKDRETGETIYSFTILTTRPNSVAARIHSRMPVIIPRDQETAWLACRLPYEDLCTPYNETPMEAYPVSSAVNAPGNNTVDVIRPVVQQPTLWGGSTG